MCPNHQELERINNETLRQLFSCKIVLARKGTQAQAFMSACVIERTCMSVCKCMVLKELPIYNTFCAYL